MYVGKYVGILKTDLQKKQAGGKNPNWDNKVDFISRICNKYSGLTYQVLMYSLMVEFACKNKKSR